MNVRDGGIRSVRYGGDGGDFSVLRKYCGGDEWNGVVAACRALPLPNGSSEQG